mmetsp:Transcript_18066/g.39326  ORF Transcript_18066/g.39326 Transcript_18066/m.39326 type:complete len:639 (+) Transcript_18066:158-2074(+)
MGKKTKFIEKADSQKFHLLHRSQRDEAHQGYEVPSNFVLVPAVDNGKGGSNAGSVPAAYLSTRDPGLSKVGRRDHVDELGFANDGYDYSQHLRELGSGHFIPAAGQAALDLTTMRSQSRAVELPEDCMPSVALLERGLEAITINGDLMDADIRDALFGDCDEEGDFEELQDDFVMQAMQEPDEPDFDFDAHIQLLIARSEQQLGLNSAVNDKFKKGVHFEGEEDEEDEEDEDFPDELLDVEYLASAARARAEKNWGKDKNAVGPLSAEAREALESQFESLLEEYEDEELGYLDDLNEEDIGGNIGLEEVEASGALQEALDEYLQEQKDSIFQEGTNVKKGDRGSIHTPKSRKIEEEKAEAEFTAELGRQARVEQEERQKACGEEVRDLLAAGKDKGIETCQSYLAEVRIEEEWDCETILSTYSTLDNHPTLIKDVNPKFRKYKSHHARRLEAEESGRSTAGSVSGASAMSGATGATGVTGASGASGATGASSRRGGSVGSAVRGNQPGRIVLSGRLNLPEGYGPTMFEKKKKENPLRSVVDDRDLRGIEEEEDDEEGSDSDYSDQGEDEGKEHTGGLRRRQETPEEKKKRKAAVKEERRVKRSEKKEVKTAFKIEGNKIMRHAGTKQSIDDISVFRYS